MNDMSNIEVLIESSKKITLLYVEDNLEARQSTLTILEEFFDNIIVAVNGDDGLHKYESNAIDLIITDINMPVMNGLEMVDHIRKIDDSVPILIFSAYNESDYFIDSIKSGVEGYLLKPIDINQFTILLNKVVQKRKLQMEAKISANFLQQYKEIIDKSAIITIIDTNEVITYANDEFCKISEYKIDELIGKKYCLISDYSQNKELRDEIWLTIKDKKQVWQGVTKHISKSGRLYYLKDTIKPIMDINGTILEYIAFRNDITDIRLAAIEKEKFLIIAKEQADKANAAKSEFLSSMSHELRTPMNAILGFAQILEFDDTLGNEQLDSVDEILKAGSHLLKLINDVLDLAKIESGHTELSLESVKISNLVDECFTLIAPVAKTQGIDISYDYVDDYFVRADRTRLKQVLLNLLSNAIKYNRKRGRVELKISVVKANILRIMIVDTGKGIADERLGELFQPFNRLDIEDSEIEGTGIGLAITKSLIEMMGGHIGVNSQLNFGSCFWVELPLETLSSVNFYDTENKLLEKATLTTKKLHTVLYIEDNFANLKLVTRIMDSQPQINLITADNAELGLELANAHLPELILLDINLSRMNGYQVLSILQSNELLKDIPVVAVTANAMARDIERGKAAGFSDYLVKPINVAAFTSVLNHYLK